MKWKSDSDKNNRRKRRRARKECTIRFACPCFTCSCSFFNFCSNFSRYSLHSLDHHTIVVCVCVLLFNATDSKKLLDCVTDTLHTSVFFKYTFQFVVVYRIHAVFCCYRYCALFSHINAKTLVDIYREHAFCFLNVLSIFRPFFSLELAMLQFEWLLSLFGILLLLLRHHHHHSISSSYRHCRLWRKCLNILFVIFWTVSLSLCYFCKWNFLCCCRLSDICNIDDQTWVLKSSEPGFILFRWKYLSNPIKVSLAY